MSNAELQSRKIIILSSNYDLNGVMMLNKEKKTYSLVYVFALCTE